MTRLEEWVSAETSFRALIDNQWRGDTTQMNSS